MCSHVGTDFWNSCTLRSRILWLCESTVLWYSFIAEGLDLVTLFVIWPKFIKLHGLATIIIIFSFRLFLGSLINLTLTFKDLSAGYVGCILQWYL